MKTATIGSLEVSVIGLGSNNFGRALNADQTRDVVGTALEHGITYFDTARNYGNGQSESYLGAALGSDRENVVVGTKFGRIPRMPDSLGASRNEVRTTVEISLRELGTDYIDLYQLHFPDPEVPISETLEVLGELVTEGKVREIGCANFSADLLEEALGISDSNSLPRFVSNQVEYSMTHRDPDNNGLRRLCTDRDVALLPYYPLASGLLTGKTRRGEQPRGRLQTERYARFLTDENFDVAERLEGFAAARDLTMAQVALGWLLTRPGVPSVTPGATRPDQVVSNVAAADWEPTTADRDELDAVIGLR